MRATLPLVAEVLRDAGEPLRVAEIIRRLGGRLPTRSERHDAAGNVLRRDLALSLRDDPLTPFVRVSKGVYALRQSWTL